LSTYIAAYLVTAVVLFGLDFAWLSIATSRFYRAELGAMLLEKPNLLVAGLFYLVYAAGVVVFAVVPALDAGSWPRASLLGAALGLIAYGTYDFTNLATLKNWPTVVSFVDLAWGICLTSISATLGFMVVRGVAAG